MRNMRSKPHPAARLEHLVTAQSEQRILTLENLPELVEEEERAAESHTPSDTDFASISEGMKLFGFKRAVLGLGINLRIPYQESCW